MYSKSLLNISFVLFASLVAVAPAEEFWWRGTGPDNLWIRENNWWSNRVPNMDYDAGIGGIAGEEGGYAVIDNGIFAVCNILIVGNWMPNTQWCYLEVKGGVLTVTGRAIMGKWGESNPNTGGAGCMIIRDGALVIVNGDVRVRNQGHGRLEMKGGTLNVGQTLWVSYSTAHDKRGHLQLDGGTINAHRFRMYTPKGSMDITGGTLIVDEVDDGFVTRLNGYIADGAITAYGGKGKVMIDQGNVNPGKTTVTAIKHPDFNGDNTVNLLDFGELAAHWKAGSGISEFNDVYDLDDDFTIGMGDLELFRNRWLWPDGDIVLTDPVIQIDESIQ